MDYCTVLCRGGPTDTVLHAAHVVDEAAKNTHGLLESFSLEGSSCARLRSTAARAHLSCVLHK